MVPTTRARPGISSASRRHVAEQKCVLAGVRHAPCGDHARIPASGLCDRARDVGSRCQSRWISVGKAPVRVT